MFKVLEGDRPEIPSFDELPPKTSRICECSHQKAASLQLPEDVCHDTTSFT
jgi:hypothetical protein